MNVVVSTQNKELVRALVRAAGLAWGSGLSFTHTTQHWRKPLRHTSP